MLKTLSSCALAVVLATTVASAQTAPASPAPKPAARAARGPSAAAPLHLAYRAIGAAEAHGASGKTLEAARSHYRGALARFGRSENPAAAHEAMAAAMLAMAAVAERPLPTPRDLPAPPALPTPGARRAEGPPAGGPIHHGRMHSDRFDPAALANDAAIAATPEAKDLAQNAFDANVAGEKAAFAGNREEALRQRHLARALGGAVRQLAMADHPEAFPRPQRGPHGPGTMGPGMMGPGMMGPHGPGMMGPHGPGMMGFSGPEMMDEHASWSPMEGPRT